MYCQPSTDVSAGRSFSFPDIFAIIFFSSSVGEIILLLRQNAGSKAVGKLATIFFLFHSSFLSISFKTGLSSSETIIQHQSPGQGQYSFLAVYNRSYIQFCITHDPFVIDRSKITRHFHPFFLKSIFKISANTFSVP
jgi:hypothetical protein